MVVRTIGLDGSIGAAKEIAANQHILINPPGLAFDSEGDGIATWSDFDSTGSGADRVNAAGFDGAGPRLGGVTIPPAGNAGDTLGFSAGASDTWSGVQSIGWDFGDGQAATGGQVSHAYGSGGQKTVTATATDTLGNAGASVSGPVGVLAPPAPGGPGGSGGPGGGGSTDTTAPEIKSLALSPSHFAVASDTTVLARKKRKRKAHRGTTISFKLSEAADGTFTIVGKKPRRGKAKRYLIDLAGLKKGKDKLAFSGRVAKKALKAGTYTLFVVATDAAGNRSKSAKAKFTIVKR
jgi:hypothetical protein